MQMILDILAGVTFTILPLLGILTMAKKINPAQPVWGTIVLTAIPLWLWLFPVGVLRLMLLVFTGFGNDWWMDVYSVLSLFCLFFIPYLLYKMMFAPSAMDNTYDTRRRRQGIRRQLHYGVYTSILYGLLCILPAIVFVCLLIGGVWDIGGLFVGGELDDSITSTFARWILGSLLMFWHPVGWILGGGLGLVTAILFSIAITAAVIGLVVSLNGTIRFLAAEKPFPKRHLLYPVLMVVPVLNLIALLRLCKKTKSW